MLSCDCRLTPISRTVPQEVDVTSPATLDDEAVSSRATSPWHLVAQTLSEGARALHLTPRPQGSRKSMGRLSAAGQQALSGALQVAIARHPILATISPDLRRDVAAACMRELKVVRTGTVVAAQGAECDAFAVVGSGIFDGASTSTAHMGTRPCCRCGA
jgi:hypothetical protein